MESYKNMAKIITTTGTSLLTNVAKSRQKPASEVSDRELKEHIRTFSHTESSAETNSLFKIASPRDEIVFLYTSTKDGQRCATIIQDYLLSHNWSVSLREVPIDYNESRFERYGLRQLVNILVQEIVNSQRQQQEVVINATGGFKAEIAYTTIVGTIFQVPVKYIYQDFQEAITLPVLPITWDTEIMFIHQEFFDWLDDQPRYYQEVEIWLKGMYNRETVKAFLLPPDSDGHVFLSPAGEILWQRFRQTKEEAETYIEDPPASEVSPEDKIANSLEKQGHNYPKYTLELATKLAEIEIVEEIIGGFFENTTDSRIKGVTEDGVIKILWADNTKAVNLKVFTTARGMAQTLAVCDRLIEPVFYRFYYNK